MLLITDTKLSTAELMNMAEKRGSPPEYYLGFFEYDDAAALS